MGFLPKDFNVADLEESEFEENEKGGYRDTRFGNKSLSCDDEIG